MAKLKLGKTSDGFPTRLLLSCLKADRNKAKRAGMGTATWRRSSLQWSYPIDPTILTNLLHLFGSDLAVDEELTKYLESVGAEQQSVIKYTTQGGDLNDRLLPYQQEATRFIIAAKKCILGLDMGLGKTVVAAVGLNHVKSDKILVICPNIIKLSWMSHIFEWHGVKSVVVDRQRIKGYDDIIHGDHDKREDQITEILSQNTFSLIINFEQFRIHQDTFKKYSYDVLIIDEAHRVCNRKTQTAKAITTITKHIPYIWLLTGTPIANFFTDVWTLLNIINPYRFSGFWNFVNIYMYTVENYFGGTDIIGIKSEEQFNHMLSKFVHRKSKAEVLPQLPPKIYSDYPHFMPTTQQAIYESMEQEVIEELKEYISPDKQDILLLPNTITKLIRLRQICLSPQLIGGPSDSGRILALRDLMEDLKDSKQQFLVYTSFREFLHIISELMNELGIHHELIQGGQTTSHRIEIEQALNEGKIQAIGGMITAMGESLNLQAADTVIFADKSWSNRANIQAENRVHRMNITESKNIITLYTPNTIEEDIIKTCVKKQQIFDETIGQINAVKEMLLRRGV